MNKYIILLTILLTHQGFGTNAVKQLYPDPPEKISMNAINQSITEFNENIDIANTRKYEIQKVRVYLLSFSPLLVHGIYRLASNLSGDVVSEVTAGKILGITLETTAGLFFLANGIKTTDIMWREDYDRKVAVDKCISLYNNISTRQVEKIKEINPN